MLARPGRGTADNSAAAAGKASGRRARGQPRATPKPPGAATWDVQRARRHSRKLTLGQVQFPRSSCQHALDLDGLVLLGCIALRRSNAAAATHAAAHPSPRLGRRPVAALLAPAAECAAAIAGALLPAPRCCWRRCCCRGRACPRLASRPACSARRDPSCRHVGQCAAAVLYTQGLALSASLALQHALGTGNGLAGAGRLPQGRAPLAVWKGHQRWRRCGSVAAIATTGGSVPCFSGVIVIQMSSDWAALSPSSASCCPLTWLGFEVRPGLLQLLRLLLLLGQP